MFGKVTVGVASHWPYVADFSGLSTYGLNGLRKADEHQHCLCCSKECGILYILYLYLLLPWGRRHLLIGRVYWQTDLIWTLGEEYEEHHVEHSLICSRDIDIVISYRKRLEAFEMWIWRRMEPVSWKDMVTKAYVLQRVNETRSI